MSHTHLHNRVCHSIHTYTIIATQYSNKSTRERGREEVLYIECTSMNVHWNEKVVYLATKGHELNVSKIKTALATYSYTVGAAISFATEGG